MTIDPRLSALTARELEILLAIGHGRTNREIAAQLCLAESTVKTHVKHVLAKTGARDRVQAVILTYDLGLIRPIPGQKSFAANTPGNAAGDQYAPDLPSVVRADVHTARSWCREIVIAGRGEKNSPAPGTRRGVK